LVGLQTTSVKQQLGPLLNGIVNYDFWIPAKTLQAFRPAIYFLVNYA
jgi:branched-chain amino acid transport system substrate-binding protein